MGRRTPSDSHIVINPVILGTFLAVGVVAVISMVAALCASHAKSRKASPQQSSSQSKSSSPSNNETAITNPIPTPTPTPPPPTIATTAATTVAVSSTPLPSPPNRTPVSSTPLPSPPNRTPLVLIEKEGSPQGQQQQQQQSSHNYNLANAKSRRKLSANLSMKLGGNTLAKYRSRKEEQPQEKQSKPEEESVWTKTIILGEKCKVPSDDDEAIIYNEKGNRVSSYPARTPTSLPVTRTNSLIDQDAIPTI